MSKSNYDLYIEALEKKRAPALVRAEQLLIEDCYDDAEKAIRDVDSSIYGAVATAKLYRKHLEELVAAGITEETRPRAEAVFKRALSWAQSAYPDPHTAIEADNFDSGRAADLAELIKILGYEPA